MKTYSETMNMNYHVLKIAFATSSSRQMDKITVKYNTSRARLRVTKNGI